MSYEDAAEIWEDYSDSYAAGWLILPKDDNELWQTIKHKIEPEVKTKKKLKNMANINPNETQAQAQVRQIEAWLLKGKTLTSLEALHLFGCMRLASRISDLRLKFGYQDTIKVRKITLPSGKRVAQYYFEKENQ